jgi:uncharacterized membrane protein
MQPQQSQQPIYPSPQDHLAPSSTAAPQTQQTLPSAFSLFRPSWNAFKINAWIFVLGVVVPLLLALLPVILFIGVIGLHSGSNNTPDLYANTNTSSVTLANIVSVIFGILALIAIAIFFFPFMYVLKLQSAKGVKMTFGSTLKQSRRFIGKMLGLYVVRSILIIVGFILLIVPGFFMWRRYMLAPYYLIDENLKIGEALKKSAQDSKPFSYAIWGIIGVYVLMWAIGVIPIIGGLVSGVMGIVYCCAQATRYLQIKKMKS